MFTLNPMFPNATDAQKWDQFRLWRMSQLQMTDFTQANDCELSKEKIQEFKDYRSFLRHAKEQYERVEDIVFPAYAEMRDYKVVLVSQSYAVLGLFP